jgi:hypothetical protein
MTQTTIDVFQQATERGLHLKAVGNDLHVNPARCCPPDFAQRLRERKPQLLALLSRPFVMVYSQALGETIFFAEDEDTRGALIEAGASEWSIYTKHELLVLVAQNRAKPFIPDEICKLYEIKRTFHSRIVCHTIRGIISIIVEG